MESLQRARLASARNARVEIIGVYQSNEASAEQQLKPNTMDPPVEARLRFIFS